MEFTHSSTCKEEVKHYFSQLTREWEMIHYTIDEYIAQGERVVALGNCSFRHKQTGKVLDTPKADFHKFRAGKICEFFEFYDTAQAISRATPERGIGLNRLKVLNDSSAPGSNRQSLSG